MSLAAILALVSAFFFLCIMVFQVLLIAGKPWGRLAWGGTHDGPLPRNLRIASGFSLLLLAFFLLVNLHFAGIANLTNDPKLQNIFGWIVTGYTGLGILMNAISRSHSERLLWTPVLIIMFLINLQVMLNH